MVPTRKRMSWIEQSVTNACNFTSTCCLLNCNSCETGEFRTVTSRVPRRNRPGLLNFANSGPTASAQAPSNFAVACSRPYPFFATSRLRISAIRFGLRPNRCLEAISLIISFGSSSRCDTDSFAYFLAIVPASP